jgi:pyruvate dehydrogenase E1 component
MAFVRMLNVMLKDKIIGKHVSCRLWWMSRAPSVWKACSARSASGTKMGSNMCRRMHDQLMFYKESVDGQILQDGINEAGAMADWLAAATSYSVHGVPMIPFYIFYSMFGMQRTMDLCWAAGDSRARGFLIGGTAGRTTLNGEGLQHEDGHSHVLAHTIPNCKSYDPTFSFEVAVIFQDGLRRMYVDQEDVYYYLTVMNENYEHPEMPAGVEADIIKGMYKFRKGAESNGPARAVMGSGTIFREVIAAAELLKADWGVEADFWGAPSFNELARDGQDVERWNLLHPMDTPRVSHVTQKLVGAQGPVIVATDYIRLYAEQIRAYVPASTWCWGRMVSAVRTPARPCASTSR